MTHSADMCARTIRSACSLLRTWTLGDFYAWTLPQDENHEEEFPDRHRIPDYHLKIRHSQDSHWPQSFTAASVSEMVFHSFSPQGFQTIIHKKSWSKLTNWGKKKKIYCLKSTYFKIIQDSSHEVLQMTIKSKWWQNVLLLTYFIAIIYKVYCKIYRYIIVGKCRETDLKTQFAICFGSYKLISWDC